MSSPPPFCVRASSRRSGLLPSKGPAEAAPVTTPWSRDVRARRSHWPVREHSGIARPPSIRGDSRSHTSCTYALDRRARRSICTTVPEGTRRASERRAPVDDGARPRVVKSSDRRRCQSRAVGYHAVGDEPPQRDHEFARERDNPNPSAPPASGRKLAREPDPERAIRLPAQPTPRHLLRGGTEEYGETGSKRSNGANGGRRWRRAEGPAERVRGIRAHTSG